MGYTSSEVGTYSWQPMAVCCLLGFDGQKKSLMAETNDMARIKRR